MNLNQLEPEAEDGSIRVVVESPRGSRLKLKYEPDIGAFGVSRVLPVGVTYPFDWGFIPGTSGPDGDPLDALLLWDMPSHPGLVVSAESVALLALEQKEPHKRAVRNNRIILVPRVTFAEVGLTVHRTLDSDQRRQLEHFFLDAVTFRPKRVRVLGWKSEARARAAIRAARAEPRPHALPPGRGMPTSP